MLVTVGSLDLGLWDHMKQPVETTTRHIVFVTVEQIKCYSKEIYKNINMLSESNIQPIPLQYEPLAQQTKEEMTETERDAKAPDEGSQSPRSNTKYPEFEHRTANGRLESCDEDESLEDDRLERIELENYSLRKRCKRLENIVSQLLEKGKEEDNDVILSEMISLAKETHLESLQRKLATGLASDRTSSPSSSQATSAPSQLKIYERRMGSKEMSKIKPLFVSVSNFSVESLATSSKKPAPCSPAHREQPNTFNHIHIPFNLKKEELSPRTPPNDDAAKGETVKPKKEGGGADSAEEMEQRNEVFRSTYYNMQLKTSSRNNGTTSLIDRRRSSSPTYHYPDTYSRYKSLPASPHSPPTPTFFPSSSNTYYKRFYSQQHHHLKGKHNTKNGHSPHGLRSPKLHDIHHPKTSQNSLLAPPPPPLPQTSYKSTYSPTMEIPHHRLPSTSRRHKPYSAPMLRRSIPQLSSNSHELSKYNSDFYTKLPPKLHIVESQNENGVTLTWNATSNCDSSLVKSYQLFARELFGHKVGTMKRIGIVDALPLPMSCNIDKLKYHIKYKFAVCAIDIYGRYGKMSNFTGKFELKPKGGHHMKGMSYAAEPLESYDEPHLEITM
ncbi:activating transcription factor 7-interacting protein 1-like [Clytia hemisphaerica]|uniref:Fibronectin type-III domain-containing protein n=1 Tax=Clytia hemisphaerica TaxID=252671 RepID=A0A7M5VFG9_9CNID